MILMVFMFEGVVVFNGVGIVNSGVGRWNIVVVTLMKRMFVFVFVLNLIIDSGDCFWGVWNILVVKDMEEMFFGVFLFNGGVGNWNIGLVTSMARMFNFVMNFNNNNVFLLVWDMFFVVDMNLMF